MLYPALAEVLPGQSSRLEFFVAPHGNDQGSGRLPAPDTNRSDGPLASLTGARVALRRARAQAAGRLGPVTVHVRGGTYRMDAPLVLEPQDSGSAEAPVIFAAD